jgi:hypothetical protein
LVAFLRIEIIIIKKTSRKRTTCFVLHYNRASLSTL